MSRVSQPRIFAWMALVALAAPVSAGEALPQSTPDGLQLRQQTELGAVYTAPGATLAPYDKVYLVEAYVAFEKDWQAEYNRDQPGLSRRVTDDDMQRISAKVAEEFQRVFATSLEKHGYTVVAKVDDIDATTLIVRPAIINLKITAPDTGAMSSSRIYVRSTGAMTLYAELYDGATNAKLAQVVDAEEVGDRGFAHEANQFSNKADLDDTLGHWAELLCRRLDEARQAATGPAD